MKMKFQWFFDISTAEDTMQIITVSAGGDMVRKRLAPFFNAYKYYKLGKISMKFVPASTLPIDPSGLSYSPGEYQINPKDQFNPGLTRITNGEDVFEDLSGVSAEKQRAIYYTMMLDTRWYKWQMQRGLSRTAYPKYWQIGQLHQDYYPGAIENLPIIDSSGRVSQTCNVEQIANGTNPSGTQGFIHTGSNPRGFFQTGHKGRLGWMPTDCLIDSCYSASGVQTDIVKPAIAPIPEIEVFKVIMPPAFDTLYFYRVYVTEEVYFSSPIVNNAVDVLDGAVHKYMQSIDVFHDYQGNPSMPTIGVTKYSTLPDPPNDGGSL